MSCGQQRIVRVVAIVFPKVLVPANELGVQGWDDRDRSDAGVGLTATYANRPSLEPGIDVADAEAHRFPDPYSRPAQQRDDDLLVRSARGLEQAALLVVAEPIV